MPKTGFVALLLLIMGKSYCQEEYFVLIQADSYQPFYARLGERTFSSTATGHLILSKLKDSTYTLTIGFPKNLFPEQQFSITINKKDYQLQLKNQEDKGWGLYDPHSLEGIVPVKGDTPVRSISAAGIKREDAFSRLMAGVVNDTAVMYNTFMDEGASTGGPLPVGQRLRDTGRRETSSGSFIPEPGFHSVTVSGRVSKAFIEKISEFRSGLLMKLVFIDHGKEGLMDTILVQIQVDSLPLPETGGGIPGLHSGTVQGLSTTSAHIPAGKGQAYSVHNKILADSASRQVFNTCRQVPHPVDGNSGPSLVNSDCRKFASDNDIDKLRIRMMASGTDGDKITIAKRLFRTRCLASRQVKALHELFGSDEARFGFLEAAYPFVSDTDQFKKLDSLFTDPVIIKRFKKMTGQL